MKTKSRPYDLFVLFVVLVVLPVLFAGGFCLEALRRLHHLRTALHNGMAQIRLLLLQSTQCKKQKIQRRGQLWVQDASAQARWEKALTPIKKAPRILVLDPNMMLTFLIERVNT